MMQKTVLISLIVLSVACTSEPESTDALSGVSLAEVPEIATLSSYDDGSGVHRAEVWDGDRLRSAGESLDGYRHGSWMEFKPDGKPESLTTYQKGVKQGIALTFDKQGYVKSKRFYVGDEYDGPYLIFDRNKLIESRSYTAGQLHGLVRKYYDNGNLKEEAPYEYGKLHGIAKWYDQQGELKLAYEYEQGELINKEAEVD